MWSAEKLPSAQVRRDFFKEKLKLPPNFFILASPYFAHSASCAKLNVEWTPLHRGKKGQGMNKGKKKGSDRWKDMEPRQCRSAMMLWTCQVLKTHEHSLNTFYNK